MRASSMSPARTVSPLRLCRENSFSAIVSPISIGLRYFDMIGEQHLHPFPLSGLDVLPCRGFGGLGVAVADGREQRRVLNAGRLGAMGKPHLARPEQPHRIVDRVEALGQVTVVRTAMHRTVEAPVVAD